MDRLDLHSAFTKINLWRQTQFRKIVYIDADIVAYRAPDELFDLPDAFSAAPDIGWPDLFNTGVMVLTPNMGDYYALMAMAERGISFDGADQGLLNMYFKNGYNRLSFAYNVTPSAHYQYIPAYRHFQSTINLVHFIGTDKPWFQGRHATTGSSPYDEMIGRWWAVYDRHYRQEASAGCNGVRSSERKLSLTDSRKQTQGSGPPQGVELVQYLVKGEYHPKTSYVVPVGQPPEQQSQRHGQQHYYPPGASADSQHHQEYHHEHHYQGQPQGEVHHHTTQQAPPSDAFRAFEGSHTEAREGQVSDHQQPAPAPPPAPSHQEAEHKPDAPQAPPPGPSWDAQRLVPESCNYICRIASDFCKDNHRRQTPSQRL
jgi:glycogenin